MENTHPVSSGSAKTSAPGTAAKKSGGWKFMLKGLLLVFLLLFGIGVGAAAFVMGRYYQSSNPLEILKKMTGQVAAMDHPENYFPGQTHLNILCLGLDRNIVHSKDPKINGMPTTKDARSDVMMIASVDLLTKKVAILSVPRDTRVKLPRLDRWAKINEAHARGGVGYTIDTVSQFLGIHIDKFVVIKQEAIMEVVNSLGGLDLKVPHRHGLRRQLGPAPRPPEGGRLQAGRHAGRRLHALPPRRGRRFWPHQAPAAGDPEAFGAGLQPAGPGEGARPDQRHQQVHPERTSRRTSNWRWVT